MTIPASSLTVLRSAKGTTNAICHHWARQRSSVTFLDRPEANTKSKPFVLLPAYGQQWSFAFATNSWRHYSTAILGRSREICFWPVVPPNARKIKNLSVWDDVLSRDFLYTETVLVSGGHLDNFWHAMFVYNEWCRYRLDPSVSFLIESSFPGIPTHATTWADALGIERERIVLHDRPVIAQNLVGASLANVPWHIDWSCLHGVFQENAPAGTPNGHVLIYVRNHSGLERDIPMSIITELSDSIAQRLSHTPVKFFTGLENWNETRELFFNARIVIGQHGAGLVNVLLCKLGTPVVEFVTSRVFRPWQMFGGFTIDLPWWPVLLSSFANRVEILAAVEVIEAAMRSSET